MNAKTIVQKFGGSSLATPELREIAASRVLEARQRGASPVVVCSAIGRSPDPYATDSLLALLGPSRGGANRDLLLSCGEAIACAVFAELLTTWGADAQAMTGGQAGIITDAAYGEAKILRVEPDNVFALLERGIIPVITGFQGVSERGAVTTLGRGGSDLSAIALGDALGSEAVEIFTDVSGVMTGDPRRIAGAHTIDRVSYAEMVELAADGAKVMHAKAAELARVTQTPYVVKGLRSNFGSTIDEGHAPNGFMPVTGITSLRDVVFVRVIQGEIDDLEARRQIELEVFRRAAESDVSVDMINVNNAGIFFIIDSEYLATIRRVFGGLNMALRVRAHCAKISIVGAGMRGVSGVMYRVVQALSEAGVEIIHSTDSNITISVLVPEEDVARAEQAVHDYFRLGRGQDATPPEMAAGVQR
ncbi:MAG: aspartate kinase [Candidatus Eremiobacteraeota bacterium]|nr:aspartate kinase [Candidatus Eremiobacteraeota bacterium]